MDAILHDSVSKNLLKSKKREQADATSTSPLKDFKTLAENSPDIICRFSRTYHHVYVNPAIEKITGIPTAVFIGRTPHETGMPPEFADFWTGHIETVFRSRRSKSIEFMFPTPLGEKHFQSLLVPELDDDGLVDTVLSMSRDITELKELQRRKDEFLGIVSHELKTPITSIKAFTQVLQKKFINEGNDYHAKQLSKVDNQLSKLTTLIGDLLDVTRIQSGRIVLNRQRIDFNEAVEDIVENMQRISPKHKITLKGSIKSKVHSDKDRIGQVLTNLLSNAIKYSPSANRIIVSLKESKDEIMCCVMDFGMGIPKDKQRKIFERFFRIGGKKPSQSSGLGLGLYISSEIIKRLGGKIWVESDEGKGSTFCFSIPKNGKSD